MFVTNWISTTKIQKISEITNFFRHYFLSRTEVLLTTLLQAFTLTVAVEQPTGERTASQLFFIRQYTISD